MISENKEWVPSQLQVIYSQLLVYLIMSCISHKAYTGVGMNQPEGPPTMTGAYPKSRDIYGHIYKYWGFMGLISKPLY